MKYTWPTPEDPTPPIFHWLASGVGVGGNAKFRFGVGGNANWRVCVGSNMLVSQRKFLASGALPNANPQRQVFYVAVEYRLKSKLITTKSNDCWKTFPFSSFSFTFLPWTYERAPKITPWQQMDADWLIDTEKKIWSDHWSNKTHNDTPGHELTAIYTGYTILMHFLY